MYDGIPDIILIAFVNNINTQEEQHKFCNFHPNFHFQGIGIWKTRKKTNQIKKLKRKGKKKKRTNKRFSSTLRKSLLSCPVAATLNTDSAAPKVLAKQATMLLAVS